MLPATPNSREIPYRSIPGGKGAEHEVFGRSFERAGIGTLEAGQYIEGERHQLRAEIDRQQIGGGYHDHHAGQGQENEPVIFTDVETLGFQVRQGQKYG